MSNFSAICVDASLVIRLLTGSQATGIKQLWETWTQQENRLFAPFLLYYEVTNGLYRQQKAGLLSPEFTRQALEVALALPVELISDGELHRSACASATRYNLPAAYDAHYLALAERLGAELWTADARFFNTLQTFGIGRVKLAAG